MKYQSLLAVSMFALCLAFPCHPIYADVQPVVRASDDLKLEKAMTLDQVPLRIKKSDEAKKASWIASLQAAFASDQQRLAGNTWPELSAFLGKMRLLGIEKAQRSQYLFDWIEANSSLDGMSPDDLRDLDAHLARMTNESRADAARKRIAKTVWEHRLLDRDYLIVASAHDIEILSRITLKHKSLDAMEAAAFEVVHQRLLDPASDLGALDRRAVLALWRQIHSQASVAESDLPNLIALWVLRSESWKHEDPVDVSALCNLIPDDKVKVHQDAVIRLARHLYDPAPAPGTSTPGTLAPGTPGSSGNPDSSALRLPRVPRLPGAGLPGAGVDEVRMVMRVQRGLTPADRQALLDWILSVWSVKSTTVATTTYADLMLVTEAVKELGGSPKQVAMPVTAWLDYPARWRFIEMAMGVKLFKLLSECHRPQEAQRLEQFVLEQRLKPALSAESTNDAAEQWRLLNQAKRDFSGQSTRQAVDAWTRTLGHDAHRRQALQAGQLIALFRMADDNQSDVAACRQLIAQWVKDQKDLNAFTDSDLLAIYRAMEDEKSPDQVGSRTKLVDNMVQKHTQALQTDDVEAFRGSVGMMNHWNRHLVERQKKSYQVALQAWLEDDRHINALTPDDMNRLLKTTVRYFEVEAPAVTRAVSHWINHGPTWKTSTLPQMQTFLTTLPPPPEAPEAPEAPPEATAAPGEAPSGATEEKMARAVVASRRRLVDHAFAAELAGPAFWKQPFDKVARDLQPWAPHLDASQKAEMAKRLQAHWGGQSQWLQTCTINELLNLDRLLDELDVDEIDKARVATRWHGFQDGWDEVSLRDLVRLTDLFKAYEGDAQARAAANQLARQVWHRTAGNEAFVKEAAVRQIIAYRTYHDASITNEDEMARANRLLLARLNHPDHLQDAPFKNVRATISSLRRLHLSQQAQADFVSNWVEAHQPQLSDRSLDELNQLRGFLAIGQPGSVDQSVDLVVQAAVARFELDTHQTQEGFLSALHDMRYFVKLVNERQQAQVRSLMADAFASQPARLTSLDAGQLASLISTAEGFGTQPAQTAQWIVQWFDGGKAWLDLSDDQTRYHALRLLAKISQSPGERNRTVIQTAGDHYFAAYLNHADFYDSLPADELYAALYGARPCLNGQQRRQAAELMHHRLISSERSENWPEPWRLTQENATLWRNCVRLMALLDRRDLALDLTQRSLQTHRGQDLMPHLEAYMGVLSVLIPKENAQPQVRQVLEAVYPLWLEHIQAQPIKGSRYMYMVRHLVACGMMQQAQHVINACYKRKFIDNQDVNAIGATDLYDFGICVLYFDPKNEGKIYHGYDQTGPFLTANLSDLEKLEQASNPWNAYVPLASVLSTSQSRVGLIEKSKSSNLDERWVARRILAQIDAMEGRDKFRLKEVDDLLKSSSLSGDERAELRMLRAYLRELDSWGHVKLVAADDLRLAVANSETPDLKLKAILMLADRYAGIEDYVTAINLIQSVRHHFEGKAANEVIDTKIAAFEKNHQRSGHRRQSQEIVAIRRKYQARLDYVGKMIERAEQAGEGQKKISSLKKAYRSIENEMLDSYR